MSASIAPSSTDHENNSGSGGENKKRNKLGYHRTAVACGEFILISSWLLCSLKISTQVIADDGKFDVYLRSTLPKYDVRIVSACEKIVNSSLWIIQVTLRKPTDPNPKRNPTPLRPTRLTILHRPQFLGLQFRSMQTAIYQDELP